MSPSGAGPKAAEAKILKEALQAPGQTKSISRMPSPSADDSRHSGQPICREWPARIRSNASQVIGLGACPVTHPQMLPSQRTWALSCA